MVDAGEILNDILNVYGIPVLKLDHFKAAQCAQWKGAVEYVPMATADLKGKHKAVDAIQDPSVLIIYESEALGVFILVVQKEIPTTPPE